MKDIIKNVHIISENYDSNDLYDIKIENGIIKEIGMNLDNEDFYEINCDRMYAIPGLIDMNCRIGAPGFEQIEDIESVSISASRGGFTSITCDPSTKPVIDNKAVVDYIISKSNVYSLVNILPYGSMTIGCDGNEMSEIGGMYKMGIVGISDGNKSISDTGLLRNIFKYSKMFNIPIITSCDDKSVSTDGVMNEGYTSTLMGLKGIPKEAEEVFVARDIVLAESVGNKLHISTVTTKGSVQLVREAKKRGVNITCETSPHYFILTDDYVINYNTLAKVRPPLRTNEDRLAIIEGLKDGTIDVISSFHTPINMEYKNVEFDAAEYGISSLETTFPLSYTYLVEKGEISFESLVNKMSLNPAKILGLKKGKIGIGEIADLTIIDINNKFLLNKRNFSSKSKFAIYDNLELRGNVIYTIVGGRIIY